MTTTIGTAQTSNSLTDGNGYNYLTRFVAANLAAQTISANTWTINFANSENSGFPPSNIRACIYVWRPSTGTRIGFIADSVVALSNQFGGGEVVYHVTVTGSAVTAQAGDVLCFEAIIDTNGGGTETFYYDGTTVNTTDGASPTNHASFIETPQNNLIDASVATTVTSKTVTNKIITKV